MLLSIMSHGTTMYSYDHGNTEVRGVARRDVIGADTNQRLSPG